MTSATAGDLGASRHLLVSQRLRERRRALGLTQRQVVARLAHLGVATTDKALSSLEHGAGLDLAKLPELAAVLDCSITWLLGLTDDPRRWDPDLTGRRQRPAAASTHVIERQAAARRHAGESTRPQSWILGPMPAEG